MENIRVRFAPSPTGIMHLGNVRTALMNYLFSRQKNGTFILRIEDTDAKRNIAVLVEKILEDLAWLGLSYDEGPEKNGSYAPYFQSERSNIYKNYLNLFIEKNLVYRCFCTPEELDQKRKRQLALKLPPRYDRTCLNLTQEQISKNLELNKPFIWRFKLDQNNIIKFYDLAHKEMFFKLKHFSDIPLTRQDHSFTFMFANFVDDHEMKITHVFRGEDHLSNTAGQVAFYNALDFEVPVFWHMPIIGNKLGKKLSKRDFGFSLSDLKNSGFLPEAICNYLAIIGGSYEKEIMSIKELINAINFDNISTTGIIKYDVEKLKWVNHHWILNYNPEKLAKLSRKFLVNKYPEAKNISDQELAKVIKLIQPELITLDQINNLIAFYFQEPELNIKTLSDYKIDLYNKFLENLISQIKDKLNNSEKAVEFIKQECKIQKKPLGDIFKLIRIALIGRSNGPGIAELIDILGPDKTYTRLQKLV